MHEPPPPEQTVDEAAATNSGPALPDSGGACEASTISPPPHVGLREPDSDAATRATRPASDEMPASPNPVGRIELHGELARGGMGAVLKGRDTNLGRDIAIKVLLESHQGKTELLQRFVDEARIGGQLQHPAIVPVYELGRFQDARPYFTMKLVKGQTLAHILAARQDTTQDRPRLLKIFEQVCQAVAYAHARGVIHRDLKPSNIMVGSFGEVQVMDWGLAKVLPKTGGAGEQGSIPNATTIRTAPEGSPASGERLGTLFGMGTFGYMPPEQALGEADRIDARADVFALGAILCDVLTGQPPYVGTAEEMKRQTFRGDLTAAYTRLEGSGADTELVGLAKRCLAAEPSARPGDAGVLAEELTDYLESVERRLRQAELAGAEAKARAIEERKRRKLAVGLAVSVLATLLVAGGGGLWIIGQRTAAQRAAAARQTQTEQAVSLALGKVEQLRQQAEQLQLGTPEAAGQALVMWQQALAAVEQAEAADTAGEASAATRERVAELRHDLDQATGRAEAALVQARRDARLLAELDAARMARSQADHDRHDGSLDSAASATAYARAFQNYGLDVLRLPPAEAARRVRILRPAVRTAALLALDDWAFYDPDGATRRRLAQLAGAVDNDPWRRRLRAARDRRALEALAAEPAGRDVSAVSLVLLASALEQQGADRAAAAVLRRALQLQPGDFWAHFKLASLLGRRKERSAAVLAEAAGHGWAAVAARPHAASAHYNLANALERQGDLEAAIAEYRTAIRLDPKQASVHTNRGSALARNGDAAGAIAEFRTAIRIDPKLAMAHNNLGHALHKADDLAGAIDEYRTAAELDPHLLLAHKNLAGALYQKGDLAGAVVEYRAAIELDPSQASVHGIVGTILNRTGDWAGAIVEYRAAIKLEPKNAMAHFALGNVLRGRKRWEAAIAEYRAAIALNSSIAEAWCNLGFALRGAGQFAESVRAFRRGHELGSRRPSWRYPSDQWLRQAERLVALEGRLPALLKGTDRPKDNADRLALAAVCVQKQLYRAATGLYADALISDSNLADDLRGGHRYNAACYAVLAGSGQGKDAPTRDKDRTALRQQALAWLRADLAQWARRVQSSNPADRETATAQLRHWQTDTDLARVREVAAMRKLPAAEQADWGKLWAEVAALRKQAESEK